MMFVASLHYLLLSLVVLPSLILTLSHSLPNSHSLAYSGYEIEPLHPTDANTIATDNSTNRWMRNFTEFYNTTVNNVNDNNEVDGSLCAPGREDDGGEVELESLDGPCTLRNAIAYCTSKLVNITAHCSVHLPPMGELFLKNSGIIIAGLKGNFTIFGHGATIKRSQSASDHGLIRADGAGGVLNVFHFNMHNMSIEGFGSTADAGGGVWVGNLGSGFFEHLVFRNCKGRDGGGLDIQSSSSVIVFHCEFYNNYCVGNGGGLGIGELNDGIIVQNCIFVRNRALELGHVGGGFGAGGGAAVDKRNTNVTFIDNYYTNNSAPAGGALSIAENNVGIDFIGDHFYDNHAFVDGGALYSHDSNRVLTFTDVVFDSNRCIYRGGGIYFYRNMNRVVFSNVRFLKNNAQDGGGFYGYYDNTALDFTSCTFYHNIARDGGGGFFLYQNNLRMTLTNCLFDGNVAELQGGGIETRSNEYFTVIGCTFTNNTSVRYDGGGINFGIDNKYSLIANSVFVKNIAAVDGGGVFYGANNYFFNIRNSSFSYNFANNYGGAVAMRSNNLNGKYRECMFFSNGAGVAGGAIHSALRNSNLDMENFAFESNEAHSYGGGIYFGSDHKNITISSGWIFGSVAQHGAGIYVSQFNTNFIIVNIIFKDNSAGVNGGGLILHANLVSVTDCMFTYNFAGTDGGGLIVGEASVGSSHAVTLSNCTFNENTAQNNHGGFFVSNRHGVLLMDSVFSENHAKYGAGGGMSIYLSTNVRIKRTKVIMNDCLLGGGGVNLFGIENITIHNSSIDDNRAIRGAGGGIRTQMTAGMRLLEMFITGNFALTEGGGMHLSGVEIQRLDIKSDIIIEDSIIDGNIAGEGSGSAIWVTTSHVELYRNSFSKNRAPNGGGTLFWMFSSGMHEPTSMGNIWSATNYGLYGSKWATEATHLNLNRDDMSFDLGNPLNVTIYDAEVPHFTASLADYYEQMISNNNLTMVDISVPSNSECTDYQNRYNVSAYVAGSVTERVRMGVANFSTVAAYCAPGDEMTVILSVEETALDDFNYHAAFSAEMSISFRRCRRGEILEMGTCRACPEGTYSFDIYSDVGCRTCPDDAICPGGAIVDVKEGYWRQCSDCHDVISCMNVDACEGGDSVLDQCQKGHEGPLCNVCSENYAFGADDMTCTECNSDTRNNTVTIVIVILVVVAGLSIFVLWKREWLMLQYEKFTQRVNEFSEKHKIDSWNTKLKICFAFFQILGGLPTITNVPYPRSFQAVMNVMAFTNLNIFSLFSVGCVTEYNFYDELRLYTIGPFIFLVGIMMLVSLRVRISKRLNPHNPSYTYKQKNNDRKRLIILTGFIFFSPASVKIFQTFVCDEFEDGTRTLVADSSVDCDTDKHIVYTTYAVCMLFVYPIGIPLYYFRNLYRVRRLINPPASTVVSAEESVLISNSVIRQGKIRVRAGYDNIQKISFLYDSYTPEMWFFEVVECFRRLFLTAVPILFLRSSVMQVILILLISLGCSAMYMQVHPYAKDSDNSVAKCSSWAISLTVLGSLCLKVDLTEEVSYAEELIGALMIIINVSVVLLTLVASVTPNESDSADQVAFETFNKTLHQDIAHQEAAKRRRSKIGVMGLEKAERITAWELRQSELNADNGEESTGRRTLADIDGFDSDDDDSDNNSGSDSGSDSDDEQVGRRSIGDRRSKNVVEMIQIRNPIR